MSKAHTGDITKLPLPEESCSNIAGKGWTKNPRVVWSVPLTHLQSNLMLGLHKNIGLIRFRLPTETHEYVSVQTYQAVRCVFLEKYKRWSGGECQKKMPCLCSSTIIQTTGMPLRQQTGSAMAIMQSINNLEADTTDVCHCSHLAEARRTVNVRSPIFKPLSAAHAMSITEGSCQRFIQNIRSSICSGPQNH